MKADVFDFEGKKTKEIEVPRVFSSRIHEDIIRKIFEIVKSHQAQPYGAYVLAGKEYSASGKLSHRRHKWKTLYGSGSSRIPRKIHSRRGERFYWRGAFIPGTVGGREAHPPKPVSRKLRVNKKENRVAIRSAIAATASKKVLNDKYPKLGFKKELKLPIVIDSSLLEKKPKEIVKAVSEILGFIVKPVRKIRAGKGKSRGRKYKKTKKILLVVSSKEKDVRLKNYGIETARVIGLNIMLLAPGGVPGRIVIWTDKAVEELGGLK